MPRSYPLLESREYLGRVAGVSVSKGTVSRTLGRPGWSRKKVGGRPRTHDAHFIFRVGFLKKYPCP
jgi:hypothetical protein